MVLAKPYFRHRKMIYVLVHIKLLPITDRDFRVIWPEQSVNRVLDFIALSSLEKSCIWCSPGDAYVSNTRLAILGHRSEANECKLDLFILQ